MEVKDKWKVFAYKRHVLRDNRPDGATILDAYDDLMRCGTDDDVEAIMDTYGIDWRYHENQRHGHVMMVLCMLGMAECLQRTENEG
jgi:hypothetical protein